MPFTPPIITSITAGVLILMQMALLFSVVIARRRIRQSLGDGGNQILVRAIRRHGNFAENAAVFIACFGLLEIMGGGGRSLTIICSLFVLGRIAHVIGLMMTKTVNLFRVGGIFLTVGTGAALGVRLIMTAVQHLGA